MSIAPYPATRYKNASGVWVTDLLLGGIMAAGGLNYWDDKMKSSGLYTKGSYKNIKDSLDHGFSREALSNYCKNLMNTYNVTVLYGCDIYNYTYASNPRRITSITYSQISRDSNGRIVWTDLSAQGTITADVFIDASTDGRLARKENSACTIGRYDWPLSYLEDDEKIATDYIGRQQAATLMLKMRLPNLQTRPWHFDTYHNSSKVACFWTTSTEYKDALGPIVSFNNTYANSNNLMIKPSNVARDGIDSDEWWVNGLLVFNVDGRSHYRDDSANTIFKVTRKYNYRTTDEAWISAKSFVESHILEIQNAFRHFYEFSGAEIVTDDLGHPVIGDMLYIRESVHMSSDYGARAHNTESNYQITKDEVRTPGSSPTTGSDSGNYARRIGVGFYGCDIHPFIPNNLIASGSYLWGVEAAFNMRSDAQDPEEPVYIPFEALRTNYVANLLIPGYAANISSYAWGEMRVFSNLSVLGDAAGIVAGYCCNNNIYPYNMCYNTTHMQAIQNKILAIGGRLNK